MTLFEQARKIAEVYKTNPKLEMIFLGGSVSRGWEDQFSDVELFLIWNEPPEDQDRLHPINQAKGVILNFHPYEDQEWSESFLANGTKFEISSFLGSTVEGYIQSMKDGDISLEKQCLIGAISDGVPFKGTAIFEGYLESIFSYPKPLKEKLILHSFDFDGSWQSREALAQRKDSLFLHSILVDVSKKLLVTLSALNEMYIHHPGLKWLHETSERMEVKPEFFSDRIHQILTNASLRVSITQLEELIRETAQLIQLHCPEVSIEDQLKRAQSARPGASDK
ncbi:DUF4037 domain-containing protein [Pseudalkalibacillus sp. R45]|uniref:DUF4037 domain-containing protein n=1 Tax=Pseudalkalibacillus sp. R45 TaxID=3457433 RepID=UPI003FCEC2A9